MLNIFNEMGPFFEDNYRRINVREYARIRRISPPNASSVLKKLHKEGLLIVEKELRYHFFSANRKSALFIFLQRAYYLEKLENLLGFLEKEFIAPMIILFGSLAKAEARRNSDIDLAIFSPSKKNVDLKQYEKKLGRNIQLLTFKDRETLENNIDLLNSILNGIILRGSW